MNKLLKLAQSKIGCGYVWGAEGQLLTPCLLQQFKDDLGESHYIFNDSQGEVNAARWVGSQVFDCSGLIQWCLQQLGFLAGVEKQSAQMFYDTYCHPVSVVELQPGDLVFIKPQGKEINHIGIYAGDSKTVEAMGTRYGVVSGDVNRFNVFGRLKFNLEEEKALTWKEIIEKVSDSPDRWEKAIDTAAAAAKASGDMGDLEVFAFLPNLIEKVYNSK